MIVDFDGETYRRERDHTRLSSQLDQVEDIMADGQWHTPQELEAAVGVSWSSINARLRDLRKLKFGLWCLENKPLKGGLWQYRWAYLTENDPHETVARRRQARTERLAWRQNRRRGQTRARVEPRRTREP